MSVSKIVLSKSYCLFKLFSCMHFDKIKEYLSKGVQILFEAKLIANVSCSPEYNLTTEDKRIFQKAFKYSLL